MPNSACGFENSLVDSFLCVSAALWWGDLGAKRVGTHLKSGTESFLRAMFYAGVASAFYFGLFHIPTPSMEPMLLGRAEPAHMTDCAFKAYHVSESGDHVLATKFISKIDRFDIVVFRYPLNISMRVVKRVIGLPGDRLIINQGELFVNEGSGYRIVRKPFDLQERLWIRLTPEYDGAASYLKDWSLEGEHQFDGREIVLRPAGETKVQFNRGIYDGKFNDRRVSDVRLGFDLNWKGAGDFSASIVNWFGKFYFQIQPDRTARLFANGKKIDFAPDVFKEPRAYRIELLHVDGRFLVQVDGKIAGSVEHVQTYSDLHQEIFSGYQVGFESRKLDARIRNLRIDRDLHFKRREFDTNLVEGEERVVPKNAYFLLGDNAQLSKDSRSWRKIEIHHKDGRVIVCEKEAVEHRSGDPDETIVKADEFGDSFVLLTEDIVKLSDPMPFPFVEERYIVGKVWLTHWPPGRWFRSVR